MGKSIPLFLLIFLSFAYCNRSPNNQYPPNNQIDKMPLKDMLKYTLSNVDPFGKDTSYFLQLYKKGGAINNNAFCMIGSNGEYLVIKSDFYLGNMVDVKIVSKNNPVEEWTELNVIRNNLYLHINSLMKYFYDEDVHIRLSKDGYVFNLDFDKNELNGIYLAHKIYRTVYGYHNIIN